MAITAQLVGLAEQMANPGDTWDEVLDTWTRVRTVLLQLSAQPEAVSTGRVHELKIHPSPFGLVRLGYKTAEWRRDDRGFQVGDQLRLREWSPETGQYTGEEVTVLVTDVQRGPEWGIPQGYAMLSIRLLEVGQACGLSLVD